MTAINVSAGQTGIYNSLVPPEGPKVISIPLDFTTTAEINVDFTQAYENKTLTLIQSIWIDNFANSSPVVFTIAGTGQTIEVPSNSQGVFPVISAVRAKITAASAGGVILPCLFLNVPLPVGIWYKTGNGFGGTVTVQGTVTVKPPQATATLGANTSIAVGGTAVTVFAAGAIANSGFITNPKAATENLYVSMTGAAGTAESGSTFALAPGQSATFGPLSGAVTANAATAGHVFTAVAT